MPIRCTVLPLALTARRIILYVGAIDVAIDIGVLIDVDIDVTAIVVGVSPRITPCRADGDTSRKGKRCGCCHISWRIVVIRRISRIRPYAVDHRGIVNWHVNNLRIGGFNLDDLLLNDDRLLFCRFQISRCLGLGAQALNGIHHRLLVRQKRIAQLLRHVDFFAHHRQHLREIDQRLDAGIPRLRF